MITPSFGVTATERVLPRLALDFTTASLDSRITFTCTTGASNLATYVNSSGIITDATNNQPRFDYDPITLACKGLLIEESRTNILQYTKYFRTNWVLNAVTLPNTSIVGPNGVNGVSTIVPDATSSTTHRIRYTTSNTANVQTH